MGTDVLKRDKAKGVAKRVRSGALPPPKRARWIVCSTAKGGSGKTTAARNIAVAAARDGLSILVVDTDVQQALARWAARRPDGAPTVDCEAIPLAEISDNWDRLEAVKADIVIFDTPPGVESSPAQMKDLLSRSDLVLVPVQPSDDDLESAIPWMEFLRSQELNAFFLLNRVRKGSRSLEEARLALLESGGRVAPLEIRDLEDIRRAAKAGIGVLEMRGANGVDDVRAVWAFTKTELGIRVR